MKKLTKEYLHDILDYDEINGIFKWKTSNGSRDIGDVAGYVRKKDGYIDIKIQNVAYKAHRLAWLYVYGEQPKGVIDHIDRNKSNNRIKNLRDVTPSENAQNGPQFRKNKNIHVGVSLTKAGKYRTRIYINQECIPIGHFDTEEDAITAYLDAKKKFHIEVDYCK